VVEMSRILKAGGALLLTLPFGRKAVSQQHRVYDNKALAILLEGLIIDRTDLYGLVEGVWTSLPSSELECLDSSKEERAIACIRASKR